MQTLESCGSFFDPLSAKIHNLNNGPWIHFNGSFGDLFFIASYISRSRYLSKGLRVLSPARYYDLLRVFNGKEWVSNYVVFHENEISSFIREVYFFSKWRWIRNELFPPGHRLWTDDMMISPLPCDHGDLARSFENHHLTYCQMLLSILDIPSSSNLPSMPYYYTPEDRRAASRLHRSRGRGPSILFHPATYSYRLIPVNVLCQVIEKLSSYGISISCNIATLDRKYSSILAKLCPCLDIPGHLLPLVQSGFDYVAGINGGALGIASIFSKTNLIVFEPESTYSGRTAHGRYLIEGIGDDLLFSGCNDIHSLFNRLGDVYPLPGNSLCDPDLISKCICESLGSSYRSIG